MGALGAVTRVGILWLLSLAVAIAAMEAGHRMVGANRTTGPPASLSMSR